jgi:hypothetical protein
VQADEPVNRVIGWLIFQFPLRGGFNTKDVENVPLLALE